MSKKKSLNQKIMFVFIIIFLVAIIIFSINKIKTVYDKEQRAKKIREEEEKVAESSVVKRSYLEKEDGWFYYITIDRVQEKEKYIYYNYFSGCNIKYEHLDDNYSTLIDGDGHISKIPSTSVTLEHSRKSKDGKKTETDELGEINELLVNEHWERKINSDDLKSIKFVNFEKDDIVKLWNDAYSKKYQKTDDIIGKYISLNTCSIAKVKSSEDHYQVGLLLNYGNIEEVRIDYVYSNGTYLTDKIASNKATDKEKEIYNTIKEMEQDIKKNGKFSLDKKFDSLKDNSDYKELFQIFEKIEGNRDK